MIAACMLPSFSPVGAQDKPQFSLPIDCTGDAPCFLQNLVDMIAGPGVGDPFCNAVTFNAHKGTDIRLPNLADMQRWGDILAMAEGVVTGTRDSMADRLWQTDADRNLFKGRECGNGIAINHGRFSGATYSTQYCHMELGSVTVRKGDRVKRGDKIGRMGLSGATQFPHIHFSIRRDGKVLEPFTGLPLGANCQETPDTGGTLFSAEALNLLQGARDRLLIEDGFANNGVSGRQVLLGQVQPPTKDGPLVYFVKYINLRKGDLIRLHITGPDGEYARSETKPLDRRKSTYTAYVGRRTPPKPGLYQGHSELIRDGKVIRSHKSKIKSF